jgi:hypothetical protein
MSKQSIVRLLLVGACAALLGLVYAISAREVALDEARQLEAENRENVAESEVTLGDAFDDCNGTDAWAATPSEARSNEERCLKPIIYLYNYDTSNVKVELSRPDAITCSYPKYTTGWEVYADGPKLIAGDKELYSLYYESEAPGLVYENFNKGDGFLVKGEDAAEFLDEQLSLLGLDYKEREEFIIYWLPKLERNEYNHIYFSLLEEINMIQELTVTPAPTQFIRVNMIFEAVDADYKVNEQKLDKFERNFAERTVVEWGGIEVTH